MAKDKVEIGGRYPAFLQRRKTNGGVREWEYFVTIFLTEKEQADFGNETDEFLLPVTAQVEAQDRVLIDLGDEMLEMPCGQLPIE